MLKQKKTDFGTEKRTSLTRFAAFQSNNRFSIYAISYELYLIH